VATGNFTPTKVLTTTVTFTEHTVLTEYTTLPPSATPSQPACGSVGPANCSLLYVSYLQSLGLPLNASVPSITPVPTNSPRCPVYYYSPVVGTSWGPDDDPANANCLITGQNVRLFYFPSATAVVGNNTVNGSRGETVVYSFAPNITFTSPSVYLSFDYLTAGGTFFGGDEMMSSCGTDGCFGSGLGGAMGETAGSSVTGAIVSTYWARGQPLRI
jgi:hypothetical protein